MGKLGQILVARGWITLQQLTRALKNQNVVGGRLGTCLLEMDALTEDLLAKGLSEQLGVPAATVEELHGVPEEVREILPAKLARRCRAVPFRALGGRLDVAMLDSRNLACQDEIAFATGKRVKVHVGLEIRIYEALEKYYDEECPSRFAHLLDRLNRALYMWERDPAEPVPEPPASEPVLRLGADPFAAPPKLAPPPLPEPSLPPLPRRERMAGPSLPLTRVTPVAPVTPIGPLLVPAPRAPEGARPAAASELVDLPLRRPPPPPAPPRTIAVTPEVKEAIAGRIAPEPEPPAPAPAPAPVPEPPPAPVAAVEAVSPPAAAERTPPASGLAAVEAAFQATTDRDEVASILLAFLGERYRRAALFQIARDRATGWRAVGEGVDAAAFGRFAIGFDQPSIFLNLRQGNGLYMGPLPPMPAHRELARAWGGELPRDCIMLPVRLRDRMVSVMYADRAEGGAPGLSLDEMRRLAAATASAFERCILRKKQLATGL
ncbi:MAG TPA: hypothetical protein VIH93_08515 [Thermoanaerobaculia bacterium]